MRRVIVTLFSLLLSFAAIFLAVYPMLKKPKTKPPVSSFQACAAAGYPVMESYPRQCRDSAGVLFIEDIKDKTQ